RPGTIWLVAFGALQLVCGLAVTPLVLAPLAAAAWLGAVLLLHYPLGVFLPAFALLVPMSILGFALWSALCKVLVNPRPLPGIHAVYSLEYLRHWLSDHVVMQIIRSVGLPIFTTVYL